MARKGSRKKKSSSRCTTVVFKRRKRGGKLLPRSQWVEVKRCPTRKLASAAKRRYSAAKRAREICRVGGKGPRAHLFKRCPR